MTWLDTPITNGDWLIGCVLLPVAFWFVREWWRGVR